MGFLVIAAIVGVIWLAGKNNPNATSGDANSDALQPDVNIPALGATDKFSPALTGGRAMIHKGNRLRQRISYQNSEIMLRPSVVSQPMAGASVGVFGNLSNQNNDGGYKRENTPVISANKTGTPSAAVVQRYKF